MVVAKVVTMPADGERLIHWAIAELSPSGGTKVVPVGGRPSQRAVAGLCPQTSFQPRVIPACAGTTNM